MCCDMPTASHAVYSPGSTFNMSEDLMRAPHLYVLWAVAVALQHVHGQRVAHEAAHGRVDAVAPPRGQVDAQEAQALARREQRCARHT